MSGLAVPTAAESAVLTATRTPSPDAGTSGRALTGLRGSGTIDSMTKMAPDASGPGHPPGTGSRRVRGRALFWVVCMLAFLLLELHLVLQQEGGVRVFGLAMFVVLTGLVISQTARMTRPPMR